MWAFLIKIIICILVKVMYFPLSGQYKAYDTFRFLCLFAQISLMVSGFMEIVESRRFVVVGSQFRVAAGTDCAVKKVY